MGYSFLKTNDGSIGLYDEEVNDIYHSTSGAYKEAVDKFIIPSQLERFRNSSCKVLDICYGIGYNTKALLKYSFENNLNINFQIDALEMNEELIQISPFIKFPKNNFIDYEINKFILNSYLNNFNLDFSKIRHIINKNSKFLSLYMPDFDKIIQNHGYYYGVLDKINVFLHNIYYHNKSIRNKIPQILPNFNKTTLKFHINDARKSVFELENNFDLIFLDAFTASKQPTLWTKEFIQELIKRLNKKTGTILSYSKCAPFRKTLLDTGLYVGNFYDKNIVSTVAGFDKNIVKYKLDKFTLGILNTKAGIPYNDIEFSLSPDEILKLREKHVKLSDLESASQYFKRNNRKHG